MSKVKMFIGELAHTTNDGRLFVTVSTIDLCGCGGDINKMAEVKASESFDDSIFEPIYFYELDGNTRVLQDGHGKRLGSVNPSTVLDALKKANQHHPYRRYAIAIATLEAIMATFPEKIGVAFYGY